MADLEKIGGYAFLIGVLIAVIAGILIAVAVEAATANVGIIALVLVILGLIVGFLNIKDKQVTNFLVAAITLVVLGTTAGGLTAINIIITPLGTILADIVVQIAIFAMPAALVVALKDIYNIASGK